MKCRLALSMLCLLPPAECGAAEFEVPVRFSYYHADVVVEADGRVAESHAWSKKILKDSAVDGHKSASVSFSHSAQKAEIIAAYTEKADGRRLEVPKDNYQLNTNTGRGRDAPVYSDWATMTVVFPDVAVGDTVVFRYRLAQTEPLFPGQFSMAQQFYRSSANDDVRVSFDLPEDYWVQYYARDMEEKVTVANGRRRIEWRHANPVAMKSERRDFSVFDTDGEIGFSISSFHDNAAIAEAYGARALPKAVVTPRIEQLAQEIVANRRDRREQARALYEWVAGNITYAGNCIGIGAVVPRDVDFVLDNRMGDCKDHATLLQALFAARGIRSTQALVNAGSGYRLQRIPVVSQVNHVINYLPDFDLFVDATSDSTPFGDLPYSVQDKPVLLVEGHRDGLKTPVTPFVRNRQTVRNVIKVMDDGTVSGHIEVEQRGAPAIQSREWARTVSKDVESDLIKAFFRAQGVIGSGEFSKDDPRALEDNYRYQATFSAEKLLNTRGTGVLAIAPIPKIVQSIDSMLKRPSRPEATEDTTCSGGSWREEYEIELPKGKKLLALPENSSIDSTWLKYVATYRQQGRRIKVIRDLEDRTPGNVCSASMMAEYEQALERVRDNVKEPILYR